MKKKRRLIILLLIGIIIFTFSACRTKEVSKEKINMINEKKYEVKKLREDFNQFRNIIESEHTKLYIKDDKLKRLFDKQYAKLTHDMGELEFYRIISPIVSSLKCGHTNISVSKEYEMYLNENGKYLPLVVKVINNRLYVTKNLSTADIPKGSEIISINGKSVKDIINILLNNLTADGYNLTKKYQIINKWFNGIYYYYVDNSLKYKVTYKKPKDNKELKEVISAKRESNMDMTALGIYFIDRLDKDTYYSEFYDDYAVLTIKSFNIKDMKNYKSFIYKFFKELNERKIDNLILDIRGNWGGSPEPAGFLYSYLNNNNTPYFDDNIPIYFALRWPVISAKNSFKGNLYTLIDGATFSTSGHLISLLRNYNIGKFIGEESGGSYLVTDGGKFTSLKNTKLRLYYSTMVIKTDVTNLKKGRGIIPDYKVSYTLKDYLNKLDPQMKKAIELIKKK